MNRPPRIPNPSPLAGAVMLRADKGLAELAVTPEITPEGEPLCRVEAVRRGAGQALVGQMTPNEVRAAAFNMLLVAETAEADAATYRYLTTTGGLEAPIALQALGHMRSLRAGPQPEEPQEAPEPAANEPASPADLEPADPFAGI